MTSSTGRVLLISFVITLMIFVGVLAFGLTKFEAAKHYTFKLFEENNTKTELIVNMVQSARQRLVYLALMSITEDSFDRDELYLEFNRVGGEFAQNREKLLALNLSDQERAIIAEQNRLIDISLPIQNEVVDLLQRDQLERAQALLHHSAIDVQDNALDLINVLLEHHQNNSRNLLQVVDNEFHENEERLLIGSLAAFLVSLLIVFFVRRYIMGIEHRLFSEMENARATLSSITDAIIRVDRHGEILFANDKATSMLGKQVAGQHVFKALEFIKGNELFANDSPQSSVLGRFLVTLNGRRSWIEVAQDSVQNEMGEIIGRVLVLHDLTDVLDAQEQLQEANVELEHRVEERTRNLQTTNARLSESLDSLKAAQEQLVESEKMAALGGLVAGISHEINTPIGIGVTAATHLEEKMQELQERFESGKLSKSGFESYVESATKSLKILVQNLARASDLIRSFKQVAVDQSSEELREIYLSEYCDEIILSLHPSIKKTSVSVSNEVAQNVVLKTYPGVIYQVLSNLIMNSLIHAFEPDGAVAEPQIRIEAIEEKDQVNLVYSDNGRGLDGEAQNKIFEPFYTTRRGRGGSGLGMNLVYNLVTAKLRGKIKIDSSAGQGLKAFISFPSALSEVNP